MEELKAKGRAGKQLSAPQKELAQVKVRPGQDSSGVFGPSCWSWVGLGQHRILSTYSSVASWRGDQAKEAVYSGEEGGGALL